VQRVQSDRSLRSYTRFSRQDRCALNHIKIGKNSLIDVLVYFGAHISTLSHARIYTNVQSCTHAYLHEYIRTHTHAFVNITISGNLSLTCASVLPVNLKLLIMKPTIAVT
jgi:hypothetical protein